MIKILKQLFHIHSYVEIYRKNISGNFIRKQIEFMSDFSQTEYSNVVYHDGYLILEYCENCKKYKLNLIVSDGKFNCDEIYLKYLLLSLPEHVGLSMSDIISRYLND